MNLFFVTHLMLEFCQFERSRELFNERISTSLDLTIIKQQLQFFEMFDLIFYTAEYVRYLHYKNQNCLIDTFSN